MFRKTLAAISNAQQKTLVFLIRGYQFIISPLLGHRCRFFPSCSEYACQAIGRFGVLKGSFVAAKRLLRCHPGCEGGIDYLGN